jgi:Leucine-rich repeat (LRR) protein
VHHSRWQQQQQQQQPLWRLELGDEKSVRSRMWRQARTPLTLPSTRRLIGLPRSIGECSALQHLDLGNNKMRNITSSIGSLLQLRFLSMAGNRLRHLPQVRRRPACLPALFPQRCSGSQPTATPTCHATPC